MGWRFSPQKMLALPKERQHKNCAEMLRDFYVSLQDNIPDGTLLAHYREILQWLELPALPESSLESVADRYHWHLTQAHAQWKEHNLLPPVTQQDRACAPKPLPYHLYLDNLRSAHNVGSIFRTAEAFGFGQIHLGGNTPSPLHKQVKDAAMGTTQWVAWDHQPLETLPGPIIALETSPVAVSLNEFMFPPCATFVLGNEEYGCSRESLALADYLVEIPLRGRKNSLNVANTFAILASRTVGYSV